MKRDRESLRTCVGRVPSYLLLFSSNLIVCSFLFDLLNLKSPLLVVAFYSRV